MKVCEVCGTEIDTRDGDNRCDACEEVCMKKARKSAARKERDSVMRSLGLVKVRGALGGMYWE